MIGLGEEGVSPFYEPEGLLALRVVGVVRWEVVEPISVAKELTELLIDVVEGLLYGWGEGILVGIG